MRQQKTHPSAAQLAIRPATNRSPGRLVGLDAARALAIIGMLAVNVGSGHDEQRTDFAALLFDLPHGRASILFMLLAGIGLSLMTRNGRQTGGPIRWQTIVWRAFVLIMAGLCLQLLAHDVSVILTYYGVLFLSVLPLLRAPVWLLTTLALTSGIAGPMIWLGLQQRTTTTFDFTAPALSDPFWTIVHATLLTGAYPVIVWITPLLIGMILGRVQLGEHVVQRRLMLWGAIAMTAGVGLAAAVQSRLGQPSTDYGWDHLRSAEAHSGMPLWMISACGSAVLIIGVCLRAQHWISVHLGWLVSAGRLALTIYVTHLFILAWLVRPGPDTLLDGYLISIIMSVVLICTAHLWWRNLGTGPLERMLRWPPRLSA